jgi:L,D-transpeptidase ErfK/SrfK
MRVTASQGSVRGSGGGGGGGGSGTGSAVITGGGGAGGGGATHAHSSATAKSATLPERRRRIGAGARIRRTDIRIQLALLAIALFAASASGKPAPVPLADLVGAASSDVVGAGDTLLDVAERHRLGFERVTRMNPTLDPWIPESGSRVRLPTLHVLPDAPHQGLVVNLPELQLYDYGVSASEPEVLALAIGDELDPSLIGEFRVGAKRANPVWHVPESIRAEKPELPAEVPPGPDNPLGPYWLSIGKTSYGIHGTNNRWSIGREATHGCLRLYNDEIERLFARTKTGTRVRLVYQSVKLGLRDGIVYVEAHPDRYGREPDRLARASARLAELGVDDEATLARLRAAIEDARGEALGIAVLPD